MLTQAATWRKLENIMLSEKKASHRRTHSVWLYLHEVPRVIKFRETDSLEPEIYKRSPQATTRKKPAWSNKDPAQPKRNKSFLFFFFKKLYLQIQSHSRYWRLEYQHMNLGVGPNTAHKSSSFILPNSEYIFISPCKDLSHTRVGTWSLLAGTHIAVGMRSIFADG